VAVVMVMGMALAEVTCALVARAASTIDRELGESSRRVSPRLGFRGQYLAKCPGPVDLQYPQ
jgi:hypothetical protein